MSPSSKPSETPTPHSFFDEIMAYLPESARSKDIRPFAVLQEMIHAINLEGPVGNQQDRLKLLECFIRSVKKTLEDPKSYGTKEEDVKALTTSALAILRQLFSREGAEELFNIVIGADRFREKIGIVFEETEDPGDRKTTLPEDRATIAPEKPTMDNTATVTINLEVSPEDGQGATPAIDVGLEILEEEFPLESQPPVADGEAPDPEKLMRFLVNELPPESRREKDKATT
jgi:hypothetical protein